MTNNFEKEASTTSAEPEPRLARWRTVWITLGCMALTAFLPGCPCDPLAKDDCNWYLMPELKHRHLIEPGWVSLCIRNFDTNRQKCYIQAKLDFAEKIYGKPVRYSTLELEEDEFPRPVLQVEVCPHEGKPGGLMKGSRKEKKSDNELSK